VADYYYMLFLSFVMLIGSIAIILYYKKQKKHRSSNKIPMKDRLIIIIFTLFSVICFLYSIRFLPTVILNQTEVYKGKCDVFIFEGVKSGGGLQVEFKKKNIAFSRQGYSQDQDGTYYCEVEYYRNSEIGKSIKIYDLHNHKLVKPK
jgi:hypothetical protein